MKRLSFIIFALSFSAALFAKDIKTLVVTTQPQMHCASCENKIKGNLRFEKGVKQIECNIPEQRVTITYDADKTNPQTLIKGFEKFGYKATEVEKKKPTEKKK
jgi:copper chaperone CopZ